LTSSDHDAIIQIVSTWANAVRGDKDCELLRGPILKKETTMESGGAGIFWIVELAIIVLIIAAMWKVFSKAGQPGWAALIPIFNAYVLLKVAGKPGWWLILLFIPVVNIVFGILALAGLAKNFGKGAGFVLGLVFLPFIFYPILGFGGATYSPVPGA
jgi:ABC-type sulfate transport system permease subunit